RLRRRPRQGVLEQLRQVAGVFFEVLAALPVEGLVLLPIRLLGVALLGMDVLEQLVTVAPGGVGDLGGEVEAVAHQLGEARPGRDSSSCNNSRSSAMRWMAFGSSS